jgi:hypothetical protein
MSRITTDLLGITDCIKEARLLNKLQDDGQPSGVLSNSNNKYGTPVTVASVSGDIGLRLQSIRALPAIISSLAKDTSLSNDRELVKNELFHPLDLCFAAIDGIFRFKNEVADKYKFDRSFFPSLTHSLMELVNGQGSEVTSQWIEAGRDLFNGTTVTTSPTAAAKNVFKLEGDKREATNQDWDQLLHSLHAPD